MAPTVFVLTAALIQAQEIRYAGFAGAQGLELAGDARFTAQGVLRLAPARADQRGAAWFHRKIQVRSGFDTSFRFQFTENGGLGDGADGIAFVIQNNGPRELAAHGGAGGFTSGPSRGQPRAIRNSLAVFFDTFHNAEVGDVSDNQIVVNTSGARSKWPPPRLAINPRLHVDLKDNEIHQARIHYAPPLLSVYLDGELSLRTPVDLARMTGADGLAYVGFTAATGSGWEHHDLLDWIFTEVESTLYQVTSDITFARFDCLGGRNLCTPPDAIVEARGAGEYFVIVPAHREWRASIPNPQGRPVSIREARGQACWDLPRGGCGGPSDEILVQKSSGGRTYFSLRDTRFEENEGYFEFIARVE